MAAPSLHVICGFAGGDGNTESRQPLFRDPQWSEEPASGAPTSKGAESAANAKPVFRITCTVDVYVSVGGNPNPGVSPRYFLRAADGPTDIYVKSGDKLAWVAI